MNRVTALRRDVYFWGEIVHSLDSIFLETKISVEVKAMIHEITISHVLIL